MKVLSIRPPWAWLIFHGKDVENRDWFTRHRGPLLIHASKRMEKDWEIHYWEEFAKREEPFGPHHLGAIIGMVNVVDCTEAVSSEWHNEGCWGWYLKDQIEFSEPHFIKGHLSLWDFEPSNPSEEMKAAKVRILSS